MHTDPPDLEGLNTISSANKWRKELAGLPTYIAAALLCLAYDGGSIIGSILIFLSISLAYHHLYVYFFPRFESAHQLPKLLVVFGWQLIFWVVAFILWFVVRPHFTS